MRSRVRGVRNLKTMSGRVDSLTAPYQAYMQITCLEMEKARRDAERRSASQRIAEIDARLKQIELEKTEILKALPGREAGGRQWISNHESSGSPPKGRAGFKVRY